MLAATATSGPRQALPAHGPARAGARAPHHRDDDVPRDGHAVLAGAGGSGDEGVGVRWRHAIGAARPLHGEIATRVTDSARHRHVPRVPTSTPAAPSRPFHAPRSQVITPPARTPQPRWSRRHSSTPRSRDLGEEKRCERVQRIEPAHIGGLDRSCDREPPPKAVADDGVDRFCRRYLFGPEGPGFTAGAVLSG